MLVFEGGKPLNRLEFVFLWVVFHAIIFFIIALPFLVIWSFFNDWQKVTMPLVVAYLLFTLQLGASKKEGRPWYLFTRYFYLLRLGRRYYPLRIHISKALDLLSEKFRLAPSSERRGMNKQQYIIACFPHGVDSMFRLLMDGPLLESLPFIKSYRCLAASILFRIPIVREVALWTHCVDADKSTADYVMRRGHSVVVQPGGEMEQLHTVKGIERVYIKKRMGFIRLALRHKANIIPLYVFGACHTHKTSLSLLSVRLYFVRVVRMCVCLSWGCYSPIFPNRVPQDIFVGDPIDVCAFTAKWHEDRSQQQANNVEIPSTDTHTHTHTHTHTQQTQAVTSTQDRVYTDSSYSHNDTHTHTHTPVT
eukprot:GHVR01140233.1.p1 GENE.GHVR01140233.1~~GHVR01140233.1.p1  ORF type:complete len:363 (-),score=99.39 GHVR01140233.1:305-1393(-)